MGRRPIGEVAMSGAERCRKHRAARRAQQQDIKVLEQKIAALEQKNVELRNLLDAQPPKSKNHHGEARMPKSVRQRLTKVCRMLGSAHPGERAAAAKMATDVLRKEGIRWEDIML
jgi:hypothetical protein